MCNIFSLEGKQNNRKNASIRPQMCSVNLLICSTWVIFCYFTTHPPDLPIRARYPTAANTLNLPQASGLDTGIKQPAIKSLLGCKTLEKFTIKRPEETERNYSLSRYVEVNHLHNRQNNKFPLCSVFTIYLFFMGFQGYGEPNLNYIYGIRTISQ